MNRVTICIDSKKVLEEILGQDSEAFLEIKKGALANFADEHLRPRFDTESKAWLQTTFLRDVRKTVRDACTEEIQMEALEPYIRNVVQKVINKIIDEELDGLVETRIKELVTKKVSRIKKV